MITEVTTVVASGILFAAGGHNFLTARRYIMPFVIMANAMYITHSLWCITMASACIFLALGYGENSKFRHIFGDTWGRGVWSLLVGLSLSLGLFLLGHVPICAFVLYLIACFFSEPLFKNLYQIAGDFLIGCVIGSLVFLIH